MSYSQQNSATLTEALSLYNIVRNYCPLMYLFSSSLLEENVNAFTTLK
jgi:hypothetical protein